MFSCLPPTAPRAEVEGLPRPSTTHTKHVRDFVASARINNRCISHASCIFVDRMSSSYQLPKGTKVQALFDFKGASEEVCTTLEFHVGSAACILPAMPSRARYAWLLLSNQTLYLFGSDEFRLTD